MRRKNITPFSKKKVIKNTNTMKLNNYFDKIICINLDRRPDRWKEAQEQFKNAGITVERFSAVDGNPRRWAHVNDAIEGKSINDIKSESFNGVAGCIASHTDIWKQARKAGWKNVLIIEDDCDFIHELQERFNERINEVPQDWDLLYFGGVHETRGGKFNPRKVSKHVLTCERMITTTCYAIKNTCYDLALDISPTDADRLLVGGIMVVKSIDGGVNWERNNHWVTWGQTSAELERYVHADVHDIKFFHNGSSTDLWIASDGGLYYSSSQGDTIEPRMHGIQGTEFWGFGSSSIGDGMIGGAYHNGTLRHYENVYLKGKNGHGGWFAGGAGDAGDGYIHEAYPDVFFDYGGMKQFPADRLSNPVSLPYDESKIPSYHAQSFSNYEWIPNQYEDYYIAIDANLWKTNSDGVSWELVSNFITGKIYDVRTTQDNQDVIYLVHQTSARKYVKKSVDGGQNWTDITPPDALVGAIYNSNDAKSIDVNQSDQNEIWCVIRRTTPISQRVYSIVRAVKIGLNCLMLPSLGI